MENDADETKFLPHSHAGRAEPERKKTENQPFEIGDGTILKLRNQDFHPDDEFGTVMTHSHKPQASAFSEAPVQSQTETQPEDPIARIEHKLDMALRQIQAIQLRLESLDATVAKSLVR